MNGPCLSMSVVFFFEFFHTLCSNFDLGTSGQRSVLDRVRPVMTISTPPDPDCRLDGRAGGLVGRLVLTPVPLVLW